MKKQNKKYLRGIIIIIVLVIAGMILYTYFESESEIQNSGALGTEKPTRVNTQNQNNPQRISQIPERAASSQASQPTPTQTASTNYLDPYTIINSLDKTKCNEIESEVRKNLCVSGIDLIEKAIAENNLQTCFDPSVEVEGISRIICIQKINKLQK